MLCRDDGQLVSMREKIIQMLFRNLTSPSQEVIKQAKSGLAGVVERQRMPKQLLQESLRPILVNLAHYNKLQLTMLHGLAALLELLSSWFNTSLGGEAQ